MSTSGTKTVTVTYSGKTATFNITVSEATLTGITVTTKPTKLSYVVGETFSTSGMKVTATYSNNTTKDVTSSVTVSQPDMSTSGTKTVTVTYSGKTATFNITVSEATLTSITITAFPGKLTYEVGDTFDTTGMTVIASYNNKTTQDVTESVTISELDMSTAGIKVVTVTYSGMTASFNIKVNTPTLVSISVTKNPNKITYVAGEKFDTTGMQVTAVYNNNYTTDITASVAVSRPDMTTPGTKTVTVSYGGKTAEFTITVLEPELTGISIIRNPTKVLYFTDEVFSSAGIYAAAMYSNGTNKDVTSSVTVSQPDMSTAGVKQVIVTYEGKSASFNITVNQASAASITVTAPAKTSYFIGEVFDPAGMLVTAAYNNGLTKDVTEQASLSDPDMTTAGTKIVTVTFEGCSASFNITVVEAEAVSLDLIKTPDKLNYYVGEVLNTDGIQVIAKFNNGESADVSNSLVFSAVDMNTPGTKTVTASFDKQSVSFNIVVESVETASLTINSLPVKTAYFVGDQFDPTGMSVTAAFSNSTTRDITDSITVTPPDLTTPGEKAVTVSFGGKEASFNITVSEIHASSVSITKLPGKLDYFIGETLVTDGIVVTAELDNGTSLDVTGMVSFSAPDMSSEGIKTVTVTYDGAATEFVINVLAANITELKITKQPEKLSYFTGEVFDPNGMTVTAVFENGETKDVTDEVVVTQPDMTSAGEKDVVISFGVLKTAVTITVTEAQAASLTITRNPVKLSYKIGDVFDSTGIAVEASFSDGTSRDVTLSVQYSQIDMSTPGTKQIIITFADVSAVLEIEVLDIISDVQVVSLTVTKLPDKVDFVIGEVFTYNGIQVTALMSDGTSKDVSAEITVSQPDMSTPGKKTAEAAYNGAVATFEITVTGNTDKKVESIIVTPPTKSIYNIGEALDLTALSVTAHYTDGSETDVTDRASVTGFDSSSEGVKTITVSFEGFESTFTVEVIASVPVSLEITPPTKTEYYTDDSLDKTGMSVAAVYTDNTKRDVTHQVEITGFDSSKTGTVEVTVIYAALSASFSVTIIERVYILGDANGDGRVTTKDSLNVLRYSVGLWKNISEEQKAALDVDGNGKVTASDALKIQRYAIGILKQFRKG